MAKKIAQPPKEPFGGIDITFNDDGTKTVEYWGKRRPAELQGEELEAFIDLALDRMEQKRAEQDAARATIAAATLGRGYVPH